jgi:hypothetical protein
MHVIRSGLLIAMMCCALPVVTPARVRAAEAGPGPLEDRLKVQLDRTREMLGLAGDRIQGCDDERARAALRIALEMQDRAESAAREGRRLGALQLTRGARERGLAALRACRMDEKLPDATQRALRRTDQVLSHGRTGPGSGQPRVRRFGWGADRVPDQAGGLQEEAYREFRGGRYEASLRLTLAARRLALRAARRAR